VVEAHAVRIRPLQWGGWGFRVIPARTGPIVRKGPGLVLVLTDGRRLGITLDDPVTPAGLINTQLDRLRGADLRGADLRGADLRGADVRGAGSVADPRGDP
jgi:hypothetical protein